MTNRGPEFYASVRLSSDRTVGNEGGHDMGRWNYHTGNGALMIFQDPADYAGWSTEFDGKHLPGTTVDETSEPLPNVDWGNHSWGGSPIAGGATDGRVGVAGFRLDRDGVRANKAYFFLPDGVVVTGSDIRNDGDEPVYTTMEWLADRAELTDSLDGNSFSTKGRVFTNLQVDDAPRLVASSPEEGTAAAIVLDHGVQPDGARFAYAVWPGTDAEAVAARLEEVSGKVEDSVHWVRDAADNRVSVAFFAAESVVLDDGTRFGVNRPAFVVLTPGADGEGWDIHAASPADGPDQTLEISVQIPSGDEVIRTSVSFDLPVGVESGKVLTSKIAS